MTLAAEEAPGSVELRSLDRSIRAQLNRLDLASSREATGSTWFIEHPLPSEADLRTFNADIDAVRRQMDECKIQIPGSAPEMAIWLREEINQEAFLKWLGLAVTLTEKLALGCSAATKKVEGFRIADFQAWPLDKHLGLLPILDSILDNNFNFRGIIKEELESNLIMTDIRLEYSYIPALTSSYEEIRAAARAIYIKNYGPEAIEKWPDRGGKNEPKVFLLQEKAQKML